MASDTAGHILDLLEVAIKSLAYEEYKRIKARIELLEILAEAVDRVVKQNKERCGHFGGGTDRGCPAASLIIGHLSPRSVIRISVNVDQIDREKWPAYLKIYGFCL